MKKLLFLIALFCGLKANAQNYLISFAGIGVSTSVSTVKVENLTKSTSLTLNGGDILHLTGATNINSIEDNKSSPLKIYPNPMTDISTIEIYPPEAGNAVITVCEMTSKLVAQIQNYLENSRQDFRLSGIKRGFYLIIVKGNGYQLSGKLLSNGTSNGTISIRKVNNTIQAVDKIAEKTDSKGTPATVDMAYSTGDRLKFTGISGNYSTVKIDIPASDKIITFNFIACSDGDGNNYPVVTVGNQIWMAENLKTTKYNDGTAIPLVTDNTAWTALTTPAYCWYNNDAAIYKATYGALYNWHTLNGGSNGGKNVCPMSWHVPTDEEWTTLTTYLGGNNVAGGKLKETGTTHWQSPNAGATNETGFTALPGGFRDFTYYDIGKFGYWWSSTELSSTNAWERSMNSADSYVYAIFFFGVKTDGFSVRCIKNN